MFEKMGWDFDFEVPKVLKSVKYSLAAVNGVFMVSCLWPRIISLSISPVNEVFIEILSCVLDDWV